MPSVIPKFLLSLIVLINIVEKLLLSLIWARRNRRNEECRPMLTYTRLPYFQEKERYLGWNTWDEVVFSLRWNTCSVALYSLIYPVLIELVVFLGQYETLILFLFVQENISTVSVPLAKIKCIAYGNCRRIYIRYWQLGSVWLQLREVVACNFVNYQVY